MGENRERLIIALEKLTDMVAMKDKDSYSDEEKIRAAYALNMCMVSVSQIIDYDDLNILEQEYEGILNNLNLEMMPKDEALLTILKQLLDTITFFRIQEGDKKLIDREYQQKMKNAIWNAVPNFGLIVSGGNLVNMAVSLASQVGIGYMNYRRAKSENELNYEKQRWQLQRSAMEQFNGLRRELFDTAWRLADKYNFPDEYRLTERQIKQYDEILMDADKIRKYERLTTIKDKFIAYPPFWYHYGNTANSIFRDENLQLSDEAREKYKELAVEHFEKYWWNNTKFALLREDQMASACALELIDLLDMDENLEWIEELLDSAVRFSGNANDILQLCAIAYLKINQIDKAAELFRILVNESYNTVVNAQILSRLYVHKAIEQFDMLSRARYETLATRVNPDYLFHLPESWEQVDEKEIEEDFELKQVELLKNKYFAVIQYCLNEWSIRLGKLLPVPEKEKKYSDVYFSEKKKEQREKDMLELFSSKYKKNKRNDYLERLSHTGFLNAYFDEMNHFYGEISELYCLNERDKLQDIIKDSIVKNSSLITEQSRKIEEKKTDESDIGILLQLTSIATYSDFTRELKRQAEVGILGLPDLSKFAVADSALMNFCEKYGIPEPDILIEEGKDQELDSESMNQYFSLELLGENGIKLQKEHDRYKMTSEIIKKHADRMNGISEKSKVYFNDSVEFNTYFETGKLKNLRDIRQKTIAVYDDKSFQNADMLFTRDGVIPVVKNKVKEMIPYIMLGGERIKEEAKVLAHLQCYQNLRKDASVAEIFIPGLSAFNAGEAILDTKAIMNIIKVLQPMFDDICDEMIKTELEIYNKEK